jgi:hypothetical protein
MKIEMADDIIEKRETQDVEVFVASGLSEQSEAMARYSVSPPPSLVLDRKQIISGNDGEMAQVLSHVEIVDSNFKGLDIEGSEEGLATAVSLAAAKAKAGELETEDHQERTAFQQFRQKILGLGSRSLAKGVRLAALTSLLVACNSSANVPAAGLSPDLLSRPETQSGEVEDIIVFDEQGRVWELSDQDLSLIGSPTGVFEGWVDKSSVPWAGEGEDDPNVRFGRWINEGGFGIIRFERNDDALINPDGLIVDPSNGRSWRITNEDRELVGDAPGHFDGWVPDESLTEEERQEGVRWGLWSNPGGQGRIRFEEVLPEAS